MATAKRNNFIYLKTINNYMKRDWKKISFAIIIAFAVISFWRGVWGLMDLYLFPSNHTLSLLSSITIGIVILILAGYSTKALV